MSEPKCPYCGANGRESIPAGNGYTYDCGTCSLPIRGRHPQQRYFQHDRCRIKELEAVVAKLYKTKDGKPFVVGDYVWVLNDDDPLRVRVVGVNMTSGAVLERNPWGSGTCDPQRWFYSTAEEAAKAEQDD